MTGDSFLLVENTVFVNSFDSKTIWASFLLRHASAYYESSFIFREELANEYEALISSTGHISLFDAQTGIDSNLLEFAEMPVYTRNSVEFVQAAQILRCHFEGL